MVEPGVVHLGFILAAFQLGAALVIAGSPTDRRVRWSASVLVALNGGLSLATAFGGAQPSAGIAFRFYSAMDYPTAPVIALLAIALLPPPTRAWRRIAEAGLVAAAVIGAVAAMVAADLTSTLFGLLYVGLGVSASYIMILVVLTRECVLRPAWPKFWLLGAFMLRASDVAVHYLDPDPTIAHVGFVLLLLVVVGCTIAVARASRAARDMRLVVLSLAFAGAALGLLSRFTVSPAAAFQESLITLSAGRPALIVVALCSAGVVRPFFRGAFIGLATYLLALLLARGASFFPSSLAAVEALLCLVLAGVAVLAWWILSGGTREPRRVVVQGEGFSDWERLLVFLASLPGDRGASRREIAEALGILPRNVQRVVDAANRAPGVAAGAELVRTDYARGPSNQLQYRYALTPEGRRRAAFDDRQGGLNRTGIDAAF